MKKRARAAGPGVLVLHKTLDILEAIKNSQTGLALADLTETVRIPKPTAYRIAATLEARGYLDRGSTGAYRIGKKLFDLEQSRSLDKQLIQTAQPVMERLVEACKETVNLGILDGGEVVVISAVESPLSIRMSSTIGKRRYLHSTALGKVLMAGLPDKEVQRLIRIKGLPKLTPRTLTSQSAVLAEIRRVRGQGYALDDEENEVDGRCVGAPISGPGTGVVAALSISAPLFRMDRARARKLSKKLTKACRIISRELSAR